MDKTKLIIVPGLSDNERLTNWLALGLKVKYEVYLVPWLSDGKNFAPKFQRLIDKIDVETRNGKKVNLLGISAGASVVLNAFINRPLKIAKVICLCGRLRDISGVVLLNESFKESISLLVKNESKLTQKMRKRVLTITARYDEAIPTGTGTLEGATNIKLNSVGHYITSALAFTIYKKKITDFLLK